MEYYSLFLITFIIMEISPEILTIIQTSKYDLLNYFKRRRIMYTD